MLDHSNKTSEPVRWASCIKAQKKNTYIFMHNNIRHARIDVVRCTIKTVFLRVPIYHNCADNNNNIIIMRRSWLGELVWLLFNLITQCFFFSHFFLEYHEHIIYYDLNGSYDHVYAPIGCGENSPSSPQRF